MPAPAEVFLPAGARQSLPLCSDAAAAVTGTCRPRATFPPSAGPCSAVSAHGGDCGPRCTCPVRPDSVSGTLSPRARQTDRPSDVSQSAAAAGQYLQRWQPEAGAIRSASWCLLRRQRHRQPVAHPPAHTLTAGSCTPVVSDSWYGHTYPAKPNGTQIRCLSQRRTCRMSRPSGRCNVTRHQLQLQDQ